MASNILQILNEHAFRAPDDVAVIDATRDNAGITYAMLRDGAVRLAESLRKQGVARGGWVATDMANCVEFLALLLACAIDGATLVTLNARLTEEEKVERLHEVERSKKIAAIPRFDAQKVREVGASVDAPAEEEVRARVDAAAQSLDEGSIAVVMFTSGTSGRPKAAALSWGNLQGAARASNEALCAPGVGRWQLTLPMYHVGGLEIFFRSLLNDTPFVLYDHVDPAALLADAARYGCTHVSVVDKMLQDLLAVPEGQEALASYECVLLGGAAPNINTLAVAKNRGVRVFVSYGMTETCSHIAEAPLVDYDGTLVPMPAYEVMVVDPDDAGFGQLGVRGPGVFGGYLNAAAAFTADGFFLTGDRVRVRNGRVQVAERTTDMFVSGGENIYPEEIRSKILALDGVTDAYVFGAPNDQWGRRPVAFVEERERAAAPDADLVALAHEIRLSLNARLAKIYQPDAIIVLPEFPRSGIGKTDRAALRQVYDERCCAVRLELRKIRQPLVGGMRTAKATVKDRASLIVRVTDAQGRTGIGEDVAFETDWYLPETIPQDEPFIREKLAPAVCDLPFIHPLQVSQRLAHVEGAADHPLACAAVENAFWDLYGKTTGASIRALIDGRAQVSEAGSPNPVRRGCARGGAVVGIGSLRDTLEAVAHAVAEGYTRVKLKIKPGHDVRIVQTVREQFPHLTIMLDANQSYHESDLADLRALDSLNIACLEEPLDPARKPKVGPQNLFERLSRLQRELSTPLALDESWTNGVQLRGILEDNPDLRCVVVKLGKFGGLQPALDFYKWARSRGIALWVGGMYDTGVSKRLHAAFSTLPGINLPGDINDSGRYFTTDICDPPFVLGGGQLEINPMGHEAGLGCDLDEEAIAKVSVSHWKSE